MNRVKAIDTHTAGEPTRVVVAGGPDLGTGPLSERRERFRQHFDAFRSAIVNEPRGSDVLVGALLVPPHEPDCAAGVIFFNNVGPLGMCGHGTIGLTVALGHLGMLAPGAHKLDTPVGVVGFEWAGEAAVSVENVPSYRHAAGVKVVVPSVGPVIGDVAWGGNWFFIAPAPYKTLLAPANAERLTRRAKEIKQALAAAKIAGANGAEIDHIELISGAVDAWNNARNFVLCPGGAYDRSPCGTGTSAKVACLAADGLLQPGQVWRQEGVLGGVFEATYRRDGDQLRPRITGTAFVTAEMDLVFDPADPLRDGVRS